MGMTIDNHLLKALFKEKNVSYHNHIYKLLYKRIWPTEDNFLCFLTSSDTTLKIKYAKKIYDDFALSNDLFLPPALMHDVLQDQIHQLNTVSSSYIPQDHIIHSVNLYVFGVYAFFNMKFFNKSILINCHNYYKGIKDFIVKWQIFSLFHDVGYYFESGNDNLKSYNKLCDELVHYAIIKNISKTIVCKFMAEGSKSVFDSKLLGIKSDEWQDELNTDLVSNELLAAIQEFDGAILAEGVSNDEDVLPIFSIIDEEKYMIAVENENGDIVAVLIKKKTDFINKLCKTPHKCTQFIVNDVVDTTQKTYKYKYYIKDFKKNVARSYETYKGYIFRNFKRELPQTLYNYLALNRDDVAKMLYAINAWLLYAMPFHIAERKKYIGNLVTCYKDSMIETLKEKIKDTKFVICQDNKDNIRKYLNNLINDAFLNTVDTNANQRYSRDNGTIHDIYKLYIHYKSDIKIKKRELIKLRFLDDSNGVLEFNKKFNHDINDDYQVSIYNKIEHEANSLNISFEEILNYKPKHSKFDHGLVSACLLYQTASIMHLISNRCTELQVLPFIQVDSVKDEDNTNLFSQVIFAVLLHNIYTKESKPKFGVSYSQNLDINPFSYFCSFCDTLQKWGRPKLLNQSKMELTDINYLEDNFDIDILDDKLVILCEKKYMANLESTILSSESYLPGISWLIKFKEI